MIRPENRKSFSEKAWLHFFNQLLFDNGLVTHAERNNISSLIECRECCEPSISASVQATVGRDVD